MLHLGKCTENAQFVPGLARTLEILTAMLVSLKGLSHEIFRPVFLPEWMHLGLNVNRLWF
jgi:hypothetical protein